MADVKGVLQKLFPFISAAASLGGPIGTLAANAVGKALGVDKVDNTPDAVEAAINGATPDQIIALKKAEQDFQVQMAELGFKDVETLESLAVQDRDSARKREMAIRDFTPEVGFYVLCGVFTYALHWLFRYPIPADNKALCYTMLGSLGTLLVSAATYFYGTTRGSEQKNTLLANSLPPSVAKK